MTDTSRAEIGRDRKIAIAVVDAVDWDDRKTLLDIWQNAGMTVDQITETLYSALMAVARYGARAAAENLIP